MPGAESSSKLLYGTVRRPGQLYRDVDTTASVGPPFVGMKRYAGRGGLRYDGYELLAAHEALLFPLPVLGRLIGADAIAGVKMKFLGTSSHFCNHI